MPLTKNALLRYNILDECFANRYRKFFIDDLIRVCSEKISEYYGVGKTVSRRQILEDINFMESSHGYDAPIVRLREGRRVFYRYEDKDFSIHKKPLNASELEKISEATAIFSRIRGIEWADALNLKLSSEVKPAKKIIDFEENKYLKGLKFLNPLYHYILNEQSILINYQPFNNDLKSFIISPYYLKQYNNRWFLLGKNHIENYLQVIALDRIEAVQISVEEYLHNDIDFEDYFDEIIGVTNFQDKEIQEVKMQMSENIIPYISSKPLHPSQRMKGNLLTISVKLNYELESLILSFGENIKVLAPEELTTKIFGRLQNMLNQYKEKET